MNSIAASVILAAFPVCNCITPTRAESPSLTCPSQIGTLRKKNARSASTVELCAERTRIELFSLTNLRSDFPLPTQGGRRRDVEHDCPREGPRRPQEEGRGDPPARRSAGPRALPKSNIRAAQSRWTTCVAYQVPQIFRPASLGFPIGVCLPRHQLFSCYHRSAA